MHAPFLKNRAAERLLDKLKGLGEDTESLSLEYV